MRWAVVASVVCLGYALFADHPRSAHGGQPRDLGRGPQAGAQDRPPTLPSKPLGVPDYTKVSGFIENCKLPTEQPAVLWKALSETVDRNGKVVAHSLTDAVVADGILYFGDDRGGLVAISAKDQSELWTHAHGERIAVPPSVDRDFVYFGSKTGITALRRDNGHVVWQHEIEHGAGESTPIPVGDHVFASGYNGRAYCLKRATGAAVWQHDFAEDAPADQPGFDGAQARFQNIVARPNGSACDGELFVQCVFDQSRVIALDCTTGKRRWTFQAGGWISPAPTIAGGRVYVASQDKHLYCLDRTTGVVVWKFQTPSWLSSRVAVHAGQVFLPHNGGRLYQLAADTGQLIRTLEPPDEADRAGLVYSFPIIANKTAYFASGKGQVFAFDIESGKLRWKLRPSENSELFTSPVTDGHLIFVTTRPTQDKGGESVIVAIGLEP
ncbi:MAG: PQQ-binding-like beta-propeller repeat protein [Planctomycetota bacterium]